MAYPVRTWRHPLRAPNSQAIAVMQPGSIQCNLISLIWDASKTRPARLRIRRCKGHSAASATRCSAKEIGNGSARARDRSAKRTNYWWFG